MIKGYRKRFVIYNMALIGSVLLTVFVVLGIYMYQSHCKELKNTMMHVAEPLDSPTEFFYQFDGGKPPKKPDGSYPDNSEDMAEAPDNGRFNDDIPNSTATGTDASDINKNIGFGERKRRFISDGKRFNDSDGDIVTVFFNKNSNNISISDINGTVDSDRITNAVYKIVALDDVYGEVEDYDFIYYKESFNDDYKIVLAETSYITAKVIKNVLELLLIFVLAMCVFFFISLWLSKLAAKPMENAVEMERQFVADISHDLKTPITVILANNSILKENTEAKISEQTQWIDSTDNAAKNMMDMINEMLTLSSLESVEKSVQLVPVDISSIAEKSVLQMESLAYDRGVTVEDAINEDITVDATPEYIERICNSLLENALKYEPDGGRVLVSLKEIKKKAVLTVENYGSVIAQEDLPHIFERFYRGDKTRNIKKGHGLGLPIIKKITELLKADMSVKSSEAEGTVFTVTFDLSEKEKEN